jgi:hypothetical protein
LQESLAAAEALLKEACEACKSDDDIEDWYPSLLEDEWFAKAEALLREIVEDHRRYRGLISDELIKRAKEVCG